MNPLYNAGITLYKGAARLAATRSAKVSRMLNGQRETIERLKAFRRDMAPDGFDLWIHAASLGEFEQGRPIIEALLEQRPDMRILLSFFSPSGYEVRCNFNPAVAVVYLPFDTPESAKVFIDVAAPRMAIFVKYEFWGNYLHELARRNVPVYVISAIFRSGQIFFRPWGGMFRNILRCFNEIFVQEEGSRSLLKSIGIENVTVAGDTRFDRVTAIRANGMTVPEVELFRTAGGDAPLLVIGSSWERDEDMYIPALKEYGTIRAIIAPHEFDKVRLADMCRRLGSDVTMLFSDFRRLYESSPDKAREAAEHLRFLIIDSFGLLSSLYRYADAAYIGGGFGAGIHNINEAAVYGIPVVFGPNNSKFVEARELVGCGGGFCVHNTAEIRDFFSKTVNNSDFVKAAGCAAGEYIASKVGATRLIMHKIFNIDTNTSKP